MDIELRTLDVRGLRTNVATAGRGPAVLLVHGIPHTWFLWRKIMSALSERYFVIAPDLRGLGATERATSGFDVGTVASDLSGVLDALDVKDAAVAAIDLGVGPAFMLAMSSPERVRRLSLMEGLLGTLPGAERFRAPWWFGFHAVPALPETLIVGHEAAYLDYFLANGTFERRGVASEARDAFVRAYTGRESIRCLCDHYRAMPDSARQIADAVARAKLEVPTLAIAGGIVGDALADQLRNVTTQLSTATIENTAHILPEDQPEALLATLARFFD